MNILEARLIELNDALLKLTDGREGPPDELLKQARNVLSGGDYFNQSSLGINTGGGNDTIIINESDNDCEPGPPGEKGDRGDPGPPGEKGDRGDPGPRGECDCKCKAILVTQDYTATLDDYYIGVNSSKSVTITLPPDCPDCFEIIVKAEMGPPMGNRKITIRVEDSISQHFIDGELSYVMEVPYESVHLFCRAGNWVIL